MSTLTFTRSKHSISRIHLAFSRETNQYSYFVTRLIRTFVTMSDWSEITILIMLCNTALFDSVNAHCHLEPFSAFLPEVFQFLYFEFYLLEARQGFVTSHLFQFNALLCGLSNHSLTLSLFHSISLLKSNYFDFN